MNKIFDITMLIKALIEYALVSLKPQHAWYTAIYAASVAFSAMAGIALVHEYGTIGYVMFLPIVVLVCVGAGAVVSIIDETHYSTQSKDI